MVSTEVPMKYRSSTTVLAHLVPTVGQPYKGAQVGTRVLLCCGTFWHSAPLHAWNSRVARTEGVVRGGAETLAIPPTLALGVPGVYPSESHTARVRKRKGDG